MEVPFVDLAAGYTPIKAELLAAVEKVFAHGEFILGREVALFEKEVAERCDSAYAVGVANGTDALILALKALGIGPGDEVITAPNSYLASASCITLVGATPVFSDVRDDLNIDPNLIERKITSRTKAIIPVHLTGRPAAMDRILDIAQKRKISVIEDAAQAFGARFRGKPVGSFGDFGCFSLHPLKVLSAAGDGGFVTTGDPERYEWLKRARNHGCRTRDDLEFWSLNSRLDTIHAAMLLVKLKHFQAHMERRCEIAKFYYESLKDVVQCHFQEPHEESAHQLFVIQAERRDELQHYLKQRGIDTRVHYPTPIHLQPAAAGLGYSPGDFPETERLSTRIISLPIYPELSQEKVDYTVSAIRSFYGASS